MAAEAVRRLYFALWPDAALAGRLHAVATAAHAACGGRLMRQDSLHMTLAFLGEIAVARVAAAEAAAAAVVAPAFTFAVDRVDCWRRNRIVWAGCSAVPAALPELAGQLAQALRAAGFALDTQPYAAHVTLLRGADVTACAPAAIAPIDWLAADFALVESQIGAAGSRYTVLRRWPLVQAIV